MTKGPMTKDEQAILFNRILKNQIIIMDSIFNHHFRCRTDANIIPDAIQKTKDVKQIVKYVDEW